MFCFSVLSQPLLFFLLLIDHGFKPFLWHFRVFCLLVDVKPINQCPCILLHSLSHCISVFILPTCLYLLGLGSSGLHQLCNTSSKIWHVSTAPTTWLNLSCFFFSSFFRGFRSRPSSISIIKKCLAWIKLGPQVSLKKMSCAVLWLAR